MLNAARDLPLVEGSRSATMEAIEAPAARPLARSTTGSDPENPLRLREEEYIRAFTHCGARGKVSP